jgi:hypothetical protein
VGEAALLDEAHEEMAVVIALAQGELIKAVYSVGPRRQMWGADKILSSWLARDHPLSAAPRRSRGVEAPPQQVICRWADPATNKD